MSGNVFCWKIALFRLLILFRNRIICLISSIGRTQIVFSCTKFWSKKLFSIIYPSSLGLIVILLYSLEWPQLGGCQRTSSRTWWREVKAGAMGAVVRAVRQLADGVGSRPTPRHPVVDIAAVTHGLQRAQRESSRPPDLRRGVWRTKNIRTPFLYDCRCVWNYLKQVAR